MSTPGEIVRIWPSAIARDQGQLKALQASVTGFLAEPKHYTWDDFLPSVLEQTPLPSGWQALLPLAGPMLVRQIIAENLDRPEWSVYAGQALGRRLPRRLWRLLVEIKSAGLNAAALAEMKSPRIRSVGLLLSEYDSRLKEMRLLDQADSLALLERHIQKGQRPDILSECQAIEAGDVLWMRSMDMRLLRALGGLMPVRLEFAMSPPREDPNGVFKLLRSTADVLEKDSLERIAIQWQDAGVGGLGRVVESMLAGEAAPAPHAGGPEVELLLAPGRYAEVERLMDKALALLEAGVPAGDILIAFPDLEIYGQMCGDLGARNGVPLDLDQIQGLTSSPLVNWFISLLELPSRQFRRSELSRVLGSPYCMLLPFMTPEKADTGNIISGDLERRLRRYGYMDCREASEAQNTPAEGKNTHREPGNLTAIHETTTKIARFTRSLYAENDLKRFLESIAGLIGELKPLAVTPAASGEEKHGNSGAGDLGKAAVFDLLAYRELVRHVDETLCAARQIEASEKVSFRRGMSLLKDALSQERSPRGRAPLKGIKVTSITRAAGFQADHILVGGLAQGEFPRRPSGGELLTGSDRMALGRRAGLPVWRTDEEEYGGQVLGLAQVIARAGKSLTLSAPGADSNGSPKEKVHVFNWLRDYLNVNIRKMPGGPFGGRHDPALARDGQGLWAGLSFMFCGPGGHLGPQGSEIGRAALFELGRHESLKNNWLGIRDRAGEESHRLELDQLSPEARRERTGPFSGRMTGRDALASLDAVLAQPAMRRLSPSALESLAACPAAWFWGRLLGLGDVPAPEWDLERSEEGEWVHAALRLFFQPDTFQAKPPADMEGRIRDCLDKARESLIERGSSAHIAAWDARKDILAVSLTLLAKNEYRVLGDMKPFAVECSFGDEGSGLEIELLSKPGQALQLVGRVDRVDLGPGQVCITDYKHSTNGTKLRAMANPDLFGKEAFQLPVYLAAAKGILGGAYNGQALQARILPTILLGIDPPTAQVDSGDVFWADQPEIRAKALKDGESNLFNAIELLWQGLAEGNFSPNPVGANCEYCEVRHVCRAALAPDEALTGEAE